MVIAAGAAVATPPAGATGVAGTVSLRPKILDIRFPKMLIRYLPARISLLYWASNDDQRPKCMLLEVKSR
jgi:hypothetical protein